MAALETARQLGEAGDRIVADRAQRELDRAIWDARIAQQQADFWRRRDAERETAR